jgi:sulfur-oxidizing protein SoxX
VRDAIIVCVVFALAACGAARPDDAPRPDRRDAARAELALEIQASFRARGQAGTDRLQQSEMQQLCSRERPEQLPAEVRHALQAEALASVRYPEDGRWLGDWQRGERIAQSGTGLEYTDPPEAPRGGGCYGCHRLSGTEVAYGTLGPSLYRYVERNGRSAESLQRTWGRIWNAHAYNACSMMPRFGDAGILTPEQIRDVMALLFDPESPVNR